MKIKNRIIATILSPLLLCSVGNMVLASGNAEKVQLCEAASSVNDQIFKWRISGDVSILEQGHREFVAKLIKYIEYGVDFSGNPIMGNDELLGYIAKSSNNELFKTLFAELVWMSYVSDRDDCNCVGVDGVPCVFRYFFPLRNSTSQNLRYEFSIVVLDQIFSDLLWQFFENFNPNFPGSQKFVGLFCHYLYTVKHTEKSVDCDSLIDLSNGIAVLNGIDLRLSGFRDDDDPTVRLLAQGAQEFMIKPIREKLQQQKEKLEKGGKIEASKTVDGSGRRYVTCNQIAGCGAYGTVYVYLDTETGKKVAVKVLNHGRSFDEDTLKEMQRVKSEYVAKAIDMIELENGQKGLVMEYVQGGEPLNCGVQRFTDRTQLLGICIQLAQALKAFSDVGLQHDDLEIDGNILIDDHGNVKIVDYDTTAIVSPGDGIAQALEHIATILFITDKKLYEEFCDKSGAKFGGFRCNIYARLDEFRSDLTYDELIKILECMRDGSEDSFSSKLEPDSDAA